MKIIARKLWKHRSNVLIYTNVLSNSNIFIQNEQYLVEIVNIQLKYVERHLSSEELNSIYEFENKATLIINLYFI